MSSFLVGDKLVGVGAPCLLIAEVGLAHDGSLGAAHAYIDAAADAGADAVKFQTHIAAEESTPQEQFRVNVFPQDKTRFDYWERTAFTEEQWRELKQHAEARGLVFFSTPFSIAAVSLLRRIGSKGWKIGSGETNNLLLLEAVAAGKEPVLLSTGMSYLHEVDRSVEYLKSQDSPLLLMQCTNIYPCPPEKLGLNLITEYQMRYGVPVGFSDHSGEIFSGLAALALGAKAIEVHVTWHKTCFGPDVKASLTFEQFRELVIGVRFLERALGSSIDKDAMAVEMADVRGMFTKGLVAKGRIETGCRIEKTHLDGRKPCVGIPAAEFEKVIGRVAGRCIEAGEPIHWSDLA